jgi:LysM repeat protein
MLWGQSSRGQTNLARGVDSDWSAAPWNRTILSLIDRMPVGGGYAASATALDKLVGAVKADGIGLQVNPKNATPSFCSGATYLVFASFFDELLAQGQIRQGAAALSRLAVARQSDGVGVWGRWNANGPGVACLFHETGLGTNFESMEQALPGDFMKVFWSNEIGAKENGHLVVFLGCRVAEDGERWVKFWSSNKPDGFGRKEVPASKIKWALFSRLQHPERFVRLPALNSVDSNLALMLKRSFTRDQMRQMTGMPMPVAAAVTAPSATAVAPTGKSPSILITPPRTKPQINTSSIEIKPPTGASGASGTTAITPSFHEVKANETLSRIAAKYGTSVQSICSANRLASPDLVKVGQKLIIPSN